MIKIEKLKKIILLATVLTVLALLIIFIERPLGQVEAAGGSVGWYDQNWSYRVKMTVDNTKVYQDHTDFPVYVNLADLGGTGFFSNVESDGSDIVVTASDGVTRLPRELVSIDTTAQTGEFYFKAPTLLDLTDTDFYIYYGSTIDEANDSDVWSEYRFVYHFEEDPTPDVGQSALPTIIDSSPNGMDANSNGSMTIDDLVDAYLGKGIELDGIDDYISIFDALDPTAYTITALIRPDDVDTNVFVRTNANGPTVDWSHQLRYNGSSGTFEAYTAAGSPISTTLSSVRSPGTFHLVNTGTQNGTSLYLASNGSSTSTVPIGTLWTGGDRYFIGSNSSGYGYFDGVLDEIRLANDKQGILWARTESENMNSPSTFYSFSTQETSPEVGWYPGWNYRLKVTIDSADVYDYVVDFPVNFDLSDLPADFFTLASSDGSDIVVTSDDGTTKLDRELVSIDSGVGTGELWFKAPFLDPDYDKDFYIYFGNQSATETNTTDTWSNGYYIVRHYDEDPSLGTTTDSSPFGYDAGAYNFLTSDLVTAQIDDGYNFDNASPFVSATLANELSVDALDDNFTMTIWANPTATRNVTTEAGTGITGTSGQRYAIYPSQSVGDGAAGAGISIGTNGVSIFVHDNLLLPSPLVYGTTINDWIYAAASFKGGIPDLILNGTNVRTGVATPGHIINPSNINSDGTSGYGPYLGDLDEMHVSILRTDGWIQTEYYNQFDPTNFMTVSQSVETSDAAGGWYAQGWLERKKITINAADVYEDVFDFPVYIDLNDLGLDFFNTVATDGSDIVVTTANGTDKLDRELVSIDTGAQSGELWFKAPFLSQTNDTSFYIYYDNSNGAETNTTDVWSNGFVLVHHMDDDPSASAPQLLDSTSNSINGTALGTMTDTDVVSGQLGDAMAFDGSDDRIDLGDPAAVDTSTTEFTISSWVRVDNNGGPAGEGTLLAKYDGGDNQRQFLVSLADGTNSESSFTVQPNPSSFNGVYVVEGTQPFPITEFNYFTAVFEGSSRLDIYKNGNLDVSGGSVPASFSDTVENLYIGANNDGADARINGEVDELRFSSIARSTGWIQTEYYNQSSPQTFYTITADDSVYNRVILENETTNTATDVTLIFETDTDISANSLIRYRYETDFTIGGTGTLTLSDMSMVCDDDGDVGGSSTSMTAITIDSQGSGFFTIDTNTDTCSSYTILTITGAGGQQFITPVDQGNYSWTYEGDVGGDGVVEDIHTVLAYVVDGDAVNISANVGTTLDMEFYEPNSDTVYDQLCNLGALSINVIKTCTYDIGTSVSSPTGASIEISSDGPFRDGLGNNVAYCTGSTCNADGVSGVTIGSEEYGYQVTDNGSGTYIIKNSFDIADQAIPVSVTLLAVTTDSGSGANVGSADYRMEVNHKVAINEGSLRGFYSHIVKYTIYTN